MESPKMCCPSWCTYRTYHCVEVKYPVSLWVEQGPEWKYAKIRPYQSPWYRVSTKAMVIPKGSYGHGECLNVLSQSVQVPYLPLRGRKVPHIIRGSIGPRMEICESSALPITMVSRLHQSNDYIKRKLRAWRFQKCIVLVGADTVLNTAWKQSTPFHGAQYRAQNGNMRNFGSTNPHGTAFAPKKWLYEKQATGMESSKLYRHSRCRYGTYHLRGSKIPRFMAGSIGPRMEICETSALPIPMVPRLHQSNGYIKSKLRAWRVKKCIVLVGADTVLITAWPQSTPFHWGQDRAQNGNMRNFGPTNPHGTAFAPKQWLYQKEATGMESPKLNCPSRCRYRTYHCVEAKYTFSWWLVQGPEWKYVKFRHYQSPWYRVCTKAMVISKGSYGHGESKNILSQSVQIPRLHQICETAPLPIPMVPRLHQRNGYIKRKLRAWRVQKCIALVGADTVLTSAWKQSIPIHGGQQRAQNGNMLKFGSTNPRGTAFAPKQWLYQKEATAMESPKLYYPIRCRYRTYHCMEAKYPVSWGVVQVPECKYAILRPYKSHGTAFTPN